jgi:hypothetical protein
MDINIRFLILLKVTFFSINREMSVIKIIFYDQTIDLKLKENIGGIEPPIFWSDFVSQNDPKEKGAVYI